MVITQKITSLAFEIHDGKTSIKVSLKHVCFQCVCVCILCEVEKKKVADTTEVKMVQFTSEFPNRSHGHVSVPVVSSDNGLVNQKESVNTQLCNGAVTKYALSLEQFDG